MNIIPKTFLFPRRIISNVNYLWYNTQAVPREGSKSSEQVDYLKSVIENKTCDWDKIKNNALSKFGNINNKNIDAVMLRVIINEKKFAAAQSFVTHLKNTKDDLPLGALNGLLHYYSEYAKLNPLSSEEKQYILQIYANLYDKYKFLDYSTSEKLIQALCAIDEWQKSIKVLEDIFLTSTPSHAAYSTIIATLFKNNKKADALKFIEQSLKNRRPLLNSAYEEWINYILRKYKDNKTKLKHLNDICVHLSNKCVVIPVETAEILKNTFSSLDWNAGYSNIHRKSGRCLSCRETLSCLKLSDDEFNLLQKSVKDKLIVGKDLFLKTSPDELKQFLDFINNTAPYDIVLDALNIAYTRGFSTKDKINIIHYVIDYFTKQNKKMLLLGRNHMLKWRPNLAQSLSKRVLTFFTDDSSQDDPYFITAAIMSGPQTDILSKDLLRNHQFLMKEDPLRRLFQRWQWQHQWMMFTQRGTPVMQSPLCYTPCAQQSVKGWHLPYERKEVDSSGKPNTGLPESLSWLCLLPKNVN